MQKIVFTFFLVCFHLNVFSQQVIEKEKDSVPAASVSKKQDSYAKNRILMNQGLVTWAIKSLQELNLGHRQWFSAKVKYR